MLWSHSLPGQQVQFQLSLIVIMNLCAGDNNSLHTSINQGKSSRLEPAQPEQGSQEYSARPGFGTQPGASGDQRAHLLHGCNVCRQQRHQRRSVSSLYRAANNCQPQQ